MKLKEYLESMTSQEIKAAPNQEKTAAAVQSGLKEKLASMIKVGKTRSDLINAARAEMLKQHKNPDDAEKAAVNYVDTNFKGAK